MNTIRINGVEIQLANLSDEQARELRDNLTVQLLKPEPVKKFTREDAWNELKPQYFIEYDGGVNKESSTYLNSSHLNTTTSNRSKAILAYTALSLIAESKEYNYGLNNENNFWVNRYGRIGWDTREVVGRVDGALDVTFRTEEHALKALIDYPQLFEDLRKANHPDNE